MNQESSIQYGDDTPSDAKYMEVADAPGPYAALSFDDAEHMRRYEGKVGKQVVRKIDYRPIPIMGLLDLLSHIDRGNIGNAKIEGMDVDLNLTGNQYNIASTIFFVPYIIFEIPSNIVLKKAGFFPGAVFIVPTWYPRHELQQRLAILYTASAFSGYNTHFHPFRVVYGLFPPIEAYA
ncbi:hypothetical protein CSOJ01_05137 [Colletotrichum sojae]|uniref:Uncharacterized protein n=1 Tax=Colletotrichum sojae TaxID=2175907 RepID=A0A8H6MXB3_9PEZI|nr:hypothetical protein CSOJ01_05137 [Colletotrichum sojae]